MSSSSQETGSITGVSHSRESSSEEAGGFVRTRQQVLVRDLSSSVIDAIAYSVMVGLGETYLTAFGLAVKMSDTTAGLLATIPILAGASLQLVSPRMVRKLGSNKRWVVGCATLQAVCFLPLCIGAWMGTMPVWVVFLVASLYWGAALACGPAWNTWMTSLVPRKIRASYFASRSRQAQIAVFIALVAGGLALDAGSNSGHLLATFAILFLFAGMCRGVSTFFLARQSEEQSSLHQIETQIVAPVELVKRLVKKADGHLIAYMLAVQVAIQVSGPYFTPFMLERLQFSYREYLILLAASFIAKFAMFPLWGRVARRFGAKRLLWIGGVGILPMSALWMVSGDIWYLVCVQLCSGVMWSAYDLGTFLLIFEAIPQKERTSVLTSFNFANALAMVSGSIVGGIVLTHLHETHDAYMLLFGLSAVLRIGTLVLLFLVTVDRRPFAPIELRSIAIRPQIGGIQRPILARLGRLNHGDDADHEDKTVRRRGMKRLLLWRAHETKALTLSGGSGDDEASIAASAD